MQGLDDLPEFPTWIEAAVVLIVQLMMVLLMVLQVLLWTFCVAAVVDIMTYLRGY